MSEAEMLEHFWNAQEMAVNSFVAYITMLSGYLVVAFVVGKRLSRFQVFIITIGFIIFTLFAIWGAGTFWNTAYVTGLALISNHPDLLSYLYWLNPAYVAVACMAGGIIAGCKFMWDVRHPKTE